jgi:ribosomal protein L40E
MIKTLKKLTGSKKQLDKDQCRKIKGLGPWCAVACDPRCGTKQGSDGDHYSSQRSWIEDPLG